MKKSGFAVLLLLIIALGLFALDNSSRAANENPGTSTGPQWSKEEVNCIAQNKTKVKCTIGGSEECTATYCN